LVGGSEIYSPVCRKHFTDTKVCWNYLIY
jgi:thymidine kinase